MLGPYDYPCSSIRRVADSKLNLKVSSYPPASISSLHSFLKLPQHRCLKHIISINPGIMPSRVFFLTGQPLSHFDFTCVFTVLSRSTQIQIMCLWSPESLKQYATFSFL